VLVTRQVEDRQYIRALPDKEERDEMARRWPARGALQSSKDQAASQNASETAGQIPVRRNQEDSYWLKHDQEPGAPDNFGYPQSAPGGETPAYQPPQAPTPQDRDSVPRQVQRASTTGQGDFGTFDGYQIENPLQKIHPEDLPALLNASA